jgi:membrane fusion protein (multidrug efflux system)
MLVLGESQIFTVSPLIRLRQGRKWNHQSARLDKVNKDYARYANLIKDGSITQQQFDQAKSDLEVAQANYRAHKINIKLPQQQ